MDYFTMLRQATAAVSPSWGIDAFRETEASGGTAFEGWLTRDGTRVGHFANDGRGGCNVWTWTDRSARAAFIAEAARVRLPAVEAEDHLVLAVLARLGF